MVAVLCGSANNRGMRKTCTTVLLFGAIGLVRVRVAWADERGSAKDALAQALTLHASFDNGLDADFARGDKACYDLQGKNVSPAGETEDVVVELEGGRFGGALAFKRKNKLRPAFKNEGVLELQRQELERDGIVWLRLNPDEDLEPGYCDPVQIVGDDSKKGFIFLEWSKDETPRFFRYAIRPLFHIWNPDNVQWAEIPFDKRPMVQVARAPFSRDAWTHVVFTLENVERQGEPQRGRLYLNGKLQGMRRADDAPDRDLDLVGKVGFVRQQRPHPRVVVAVDRAQLRLHPLQLGLLAPQIGDVRRSHHLRQRLHALAAACAAR